MRFRGAEWTVVIDFDGGYESDTNAHVIEWHFEDTTPEEHNALALTDIEEQEIYDQLCRGSGEGDD